MIDWKRVDGLRDEVGADDFAEVVEIFLEEVDEVIDRLTACPDPAGYEADMHFLKGGALNLGFRALATICADAERMAASGQGDQIDIADVVRVYHDSKTDFLAQIDATRQAA